MYYGYRVTPKMYLRIFPNDESNDGEPLFIFKRVRRFKNATIWKNKKVALTWEKKVSSIYPNAVLIETDQ